MQIKYPHKNIYKLYYYVLPENTKSEFIKRAESLLKSWEVMHKQNIMELLSLKTFVNQGLIRIFGTS